MTIKVKAQERKLMVGPRAGKYVYQMAAEKYSSLSESKMIEECGGREHCGVEPHHYSKNHLRAFYRREEGTDDHCCEHHLLRPQRKGGEARELQ